MRATCICTFRTHHFGGTQRGHRQRSGFGIFTSGSSPVVASEVDWQRLYIRVHDALALSAELCGDRASTVMHQAVGTTMECLDCSGLAALEALQARSEQTGQNILTVAVDVVRRRFRPA